MPSCDHIIYGNFMTLAIGQLSCWPYLRTHRCQLSRPYITDSMVFNIEALPQLLSNKKCTIILGSLYSRRNRTFDMSSDIGPNFKFISTRRDSSRNRNLETLLCSLVWSMNICYSPENTSARSIPTLLKLSTEENRFRKFTKLANNH